MTFTPHDLDPELDLELTRETDVAPELVWRAWTEPDLLVQWFTPKPWETPVAEVDLRPGGKFRTVMRGPDGEENDNQGCYLEVVPNERLVWTAALAPGFRPQPGPLPFTAIVELERTPSGGTKYRAIAMHQDPEGRKMHDEMGFHDGWGAVFDQLVELMKSGV
ncbi:MAG TPA: SRPBCC family protein [Acidimicrobiia bacterium]|jgi:uncharacterized protein YndB with AHSA1/START domain|nr:SRPBCC family protein [Acidimicrobiia bacterium]